MSYTAAHCFAATVALTLAARNESELHKVVTEQERTVGRAVLAAAADIVDPDFRNPREFDQTWALVLSTISGLAMLTLLGHPN